MKTKLVPSFLRGTFYCSEVALLKFRTPFGDLKYLCFSKLHSEIKNIHMNDSCLSVLVGTLTSNISQDFKNYVWHSIYIKSVSCQVFDISLICIFNLFFTSNCRLLHINCPLIVRVYCITYSTNHLLLRELDFF